MKRVLDGARAARGLVIALASFAAVAAAMGQTNPAPSIDSASSDSVIREVEWPRTVHVGGTTLIVYAPQVDAWDGFTLTGRCAVKVDGGSPPFGVVMLEARTLTDKGTRLVAIVRARASDFNFPGTSRAQARRWADAVARALADRSQLIALDRLETSLAASDVALTTVTALDTTPPQILFSTTPAILVYVDGGAQYRPVPNSVFERVVNTRPLILRDTRGVHYLRVFDGWLTAAALDGPWTVVGTMPAERDAALAAALATTAQTHVIDELTGHPAPIGTVVSLGKRPIAIHVVTTPTELIVVDGPPNWTPVPGVRVFYLLNTTGRVLKSGQDFKTYVLVAGRWYRANSLRGPWELVPANRLPSDFAKIPDSSPIENVKASIAGTKQAREAAVAATIAQTAAISRTVVQLAPPHFDGTPSFRPIDGTELEYVINTPTPIVRVAGKSVFALENGVWFAAASIDGPWTVATSLPNEIYLIPATSPLYYVTFTHVYAVEDDTVFVGYTPGYKGAYVDSATGVVVYGTGYRYPAWIQNEWYGAPVTYGFGGNLTFTPWTGWRVALGLGWAWGDEVLASSWGWGAYPWWGPWGWGWAYGVSPFPWTPTWTAVAASGDTIVWRPAGWVAYGGDIYKCWKDRGLLWRVSNADVWTMSDRAMVVGLSYNSRTGVASSGQRGALENVLDGGLGMRARAVAVTTTGEIVAVGNGGSGLRAGDRLVYIHGGEGPVGSREISADYRDARITASSPNTRPAAKKIERVSVAIYAGPKGIIYRKTTDGWERLGSSGWETVRKPDALLDRESSMREIGEGRTLMLWPSTVSVRRSLRVTKDPH